VAAVKALRYVAIFLLSFCLFLLLLSRTAEGDHNVYLPLVPGTPLMQQVIKAQEYTWCVDARAAAYPNFVSQLRDVADEYTKRTGIKHRQVALDSSCQVQHLMPDNHGCSGCAAWIFYANWPVKIEYKYTLGFTDWRTTQGHELGHGLLGLHEMYRDSGGGIGCTGRQDTVMDCGSGVRYPTSLDVSRGCAIINTLWCGKDATIVCGGSGEPYWDACTQRWFFADGWSYEPATRDWWNPQGQREWTACNADNLRWNYLIQAWFPPPSAFFLPSRGYWASAGPC
jgi:hypothetical protein